MLQTRFLDLRVQIQTMKDEKEHIILDHKIEIERLKIQLRNAQGIKTTNVSSYMYYVNKCFVMSFFFTIMISLKLVAH